MRGRAPTGRRRAVSRPHRPADSGVATIGAAGAIAAILVLVTVVVGVGAAAVTRHRAEAAADLAALAVAAYALDGSAACDRAGRVAGRMGVRLSRCALDGWDAVVEVAATPPGFIARFGTVSARARAGPAPGDDRPSGG